MLLLSGQPVVGPTLPPTRCRVADGAALLCRGPSVTRPAPRQPARVSLLEPPFHTRAFVLSLDAQVLAPLLRAQEFRGVGK